MGKITKEKRAYPLKIVADTFLSNPDYCEIRIESLRSADSPSFYHCRKCRIAAMNLDTIRKHAMNAHFDDYFDRSEEDCEPPSGQFSCVAKCGLSGILLGAPNHHSYAETVREIRQTRFSHMSEEEYRSHIEMVKDPAVVEQWKAQCSKRTIYYDKKDSGRKNGMRRLGAESLFNTSIVPQLIQETQRTVFAASLVKTMEDKDLCISIRQAGRREVHRPFTMVSALRTAFRKRGLFMFKAGRGEIYITGVKPAYLNPSQAVESISNVLLYLKAHPGCTRERMVAEMLPDKTMDSPEASELLKPLNWLIERGHIIQFFDGSLGVPLAQETTAPCSAPAVS